MDCWSDNIKLIYNATSDTVSNQEGVKIRVVSGLAGFDLTEVASSSSNVYGDLISGLVEAGLTKDKTLIGYPYDFRRAPPGNPSLIPDLKATIENASALTGQKVTLVSHSLGCLVSLYLLNSVTQDWKDSYIHAWVPVSPAYGGALTDLIQFTSGSNEGIPWLSGRDVRDEQRSCECISSPSSPA